MAEYGYRVEAGTRVEVKMMQVGIIVRLGVFDSPSYSEIMELKSRQSSQ